MLLDIPDEVLIDIMAGSNVSDVLCVRQTCRRLFHLSHEKSVWQQLYLALSRIYPTPDWHADAPKPTKLPSMDFEASARSIHAAAKLWQRTRIDSQLLTRQASPGDWELALNFNVTPLQDLHILFDRWVVVVYQEGSFELWDLFPSGDGSPVCGLPRDGAWGRGPQRPVCRLQGDIQGPCISSAACIDPADDDIILVVARQSVTKIFKIDVRAKSMVSRPLAVLVTAPFSMHLIRGIDPRAKVVVFGFALTLHFLHWPTRSYWKVELQEDVNELYNIVTAACFLTPQHLLCMKGRSFKLLALDFLQEVKELPAVEAPQTMHGPALHSRGQRQPFEVHCDVPSTVVTLRGAVFSQPMFFDPMSVGVTLIAYDVIRGAFHYSIEAQFAAVAPTQSLLCGPEDPVPIPLGLSVTQLAAHQMARLVRNADLIPVGQVPPRSGLTAGSRGFISACSLGDQGRRGVWVERRRNSKGWQVYGFSSDSYLEEGRPVPADELGGGDMQAQRLFDMVHSYDLRDDITHCVLSEVTGRVVIGTRRGQLLVL